MPCFTWIGVEVGVRGSGDGLGVDIGEPLLIKKRKEKQNKLNKIDTFNPSKKILKITEERQGCQDKSDKLGKETGQLQVLSSSRGTEAGDQCASLSPSSSVDQQHQHQNH